MQEIIFLKKILVLADWYEPGYKAGGPIQSVRNFVSAMHERYHISILTRDTDLGEDNPYPDIPANQWISRPSGIRIYYASEKSLKFGFLKDLIKSENPDFIYLNSMYSVRFSIIPLLLLWRKKIHARVVISPRGMLRESAIKFKTKRKKLFISLLNRLRIPGRVIFHATDDQEKKDILHYFPAAYKVDMIPNFSGGLPENLSSIEKIPGKLKCVFISRIMEIKNILFFLRILNRIPETVQIEFAIYGEVEDPVYWLGSQKVIESLPKYITVTYHGPLPHAQVIPALEANHVFVLPTKGENFGHAIFEALSAGRPVLISDKTPWRSLRDMGVGWDLSLDDPQSWITTVEDLAGFDQLTFNKWSENSRQFAMDHLEKSDLKTEYTKLFS